MPLPYSVGAGIGLSGLFDRGDPWYDGMRECVYGLQPALCVFALAVGTGVECRGPSRANFFVGGVNVAGSEVRLRARPVNEERRDVRPSSIHGENRSLDGGPSDVEDVAELGMTDNRGSGNGSAGGNVGCECNARCPSLMRFWMRRVMSSSRMLISSSSDSSSSSIGSGAARLLDLWGV